MVNYYKVLKISPKASAAEIKSAYRRLARKHHPDVKGGSEDESGDFARIAKAYEVLSNPQERAFFDRQLLKAQYSGTTTDNGSVFASNNPHAQRLRQMAFDHRYNEIIDRMINDERQETLALQRIIFPTVALFLSTTFVGMFRPMFFRNAEILGKIVLLTLFLIGVLHLFNRLRAGFERYTYSKNLHDSIFGEVEEESKPYSRVTAIAFLGIGIAISLGIGFALGNSMEMFISAMMPRLYSPTLQPELIFYPPIVVLLVDLMHSFASKLDY